MPFCQLYYHIVWATLKRQPLIIPEIEAKLLRSIWKKAESMGAKVYAVGSVEDHVHLAVSLPPTVTIAGFVGEIKGMSSHHTNQMCKGGADFRWQRSYGVLSFSSGSLQKVIDYVNAQRKRHSEGRLLPGLERCDDEDPRKPEMVREETAMYDATASHERDPFDELV